MMSWKPINLMVKVFSFSGCPYCEKLVGLLNDSNIEYELIDIHSENGSKSFEMVTAITKSDMVPTITIGEHILVPEVSFKTIDNAFKLIQMFLKKS